MLLADLQKQAVAALAALYPAQEARSIVLMLCEALFGTNSYTSIVDPGYGVKDTSAFDKAMERLSAGEPIQYVLGRCTFGALTFRVTPDVLIPRPETELLCREAVNVASRIQRMRKAYGKTAEPVRILDLCTGSGSPGRWPCPCLASKWSAWTFPREPWPSPAARISRPC